jgi:hypothetical protein
MVLGCEESVDTTVEGFPIWKAFFLNAKMKLIMTQSWNWNFATLQGTMIPCCCMNCPEGGGR